jgi:hypothetical protein
MNLDPFPVRGRDDLANVIRAYGQFAMSSVNQDRQLDGTRAAEINDFIEGGADGAARVQNVVDKNNDFIDDVEQEVGLLNDRLIEFILDIVAIKSYVNDADRKREFADFAKDFSQPFRDYGAPSADADYHHVLGALVAFDNFMSNPVQR